jgi:hypothetical protein
MRQDKPAHRQITLSPNIKEKFMDNEIQAQTGIYVNNKGTMSLRFTNDSFLDLKDLIEEVMQDKETNGVTGYINMLSPDKRQVMDEESGSTLIGFLRFVPCHGQRKSRKTR